MASAEKVLEEALRLDDKDRARVAHELLQRLDRPDESGTAEAWTDELRRRLQEVQDGSVELVGLDELKRRMAERRARRRAKTQ